MPGVASEKASYMTEHVVSARRTRGGWDWQTSTAIAPGAWLSWAKPAISGEQQVQLFRCFFKGGQSSVGCAYPRWGRISEGQGLSSSQAYLPDQESPSVHCQPESFPYLAGPRSHSSSGVPGNVFPSGGQLAWTCPRKGIPCALCREWILGTAAQQNSPALPPMAIGRRCHVNGLLANSA